MGSPATKQSQTYQPHPTIPLLQVLEYFRSNPGVRKDLKQIRDEVNKTFSDEHTDKVIRVAIGHLTDSGYIQFFTEDINRRVYFAASEGHWKGTTSDEYEIYALHLLQNFGLIICDYGNATANITNQMLRLQSKEQNDFSKMASGHAQISMPFFQAPSSMGRSIIVDAIKNFGKNVVLDTIDGQRAEVRVGGISLRRGNMFLSLVDGNRVFGLYLNEIKSLHTNENSLRLEFSAAVKRDILSMTSGAYDGPQLVDNCQIVLEVHPDAAQALLWGRPQSDQIEPDGLTDDGWIRFTQFDDIRQELVDLLAGMAGRVRVVGPVVLGELVAERIHQIASIVG